MNLFRLIPTHWLLQTATLGPIGYLGKAPGTIGSFIGLIYYTLFFHHLNFLEFILLGTLSVYLACGICGEAEVLLRQKDPSCIILDEVVAMPFCFMGLQALMKIYPMWWFMLLGFIIFRVFDIFKPLGIKRLQQLPGGQGIVFDDIAAAIATCLLLHLWIRLKYFPFFAFNPLN